MIRLSIIIPHFNDPNGLIRLISSISNDASVEVLIIDDKSTSDIDVYLKLKALYQSDDFRFLENDTNSKGAGVCRNIGLKHAIGEWVLFADADDMFIEGFIDTLKKYYHYSGDIVFFSPKSIKEDSLTASSRHVYYEKLIKEYLVNRTESASARLRYQYASPCSKMIKKDFIDKYDISFDHTIAANDMMFSLKAGYYCNDFIATEEAIYCIIENNSSVSKNFSKAFFDARVSVFIEYCAFIRKNIDPTLSKHLKVNGRHFIKNAIHHRLGVMYVFQLIMKFVYHRVPLTKFRT